MLLFFLLYMHAMPRLDSRAWVSHPITKRTDSRSHSDVFGRFTVVCVLVSSRSHGTAGVREASSQMNGRSRYSLPCMMRRYCVVRALVCIRVVAVQCVLQPSCHVVANQLALLKEKGAIIVGCTCST